MTNKAYIVANEEQECEVLEKLEEKGALWGTGKNATDFIPFRTFPYVIYCNGDKFISWDKLYDLDVDKIIVFDGRNEEHMSEKYVVSQDFMNELEEWKNNLTSSKRIYPEDISELYSENVIRHWWQGDGGGTDANNRLIAIIRWVNGEDVFEIEKPKKWVVRSKCCDSNGLYQYVESKNYGLSFNIADIDYATRFDTKEEAQSWANSHQEVIEVEK